MIGRCRNQDVQETTLTPLQKEESYGYEIQRINLENCRECTVLVLHYKIRDLDSLLYISLLAV